MKRGAIFLLAALVFIGGVTQARAEGVLQRKRPSWGVWINGERNGQPVKRYVYRGYDAGFPPPAMFYYGYPGAERTYGIGVY